MKNSFFVLEIILAVLIATLIYISILPNTKSYKSSQFIDKLLIYIKQTRYQALIDDKFSLSNDLWHKNLWSIKFLKCRSSVGGIYFSIYSDENLSGKIRKEDTLIDPLTNTHLYSSNYCSENKSNNKDTLISKNYDIKSINVSCNDTSSIGQLSFDSKSNVYSKLSNNSNDYEDYQLRDKCTISITNIWDLEENITVESKTGYVYKN